MLLTCFTATTVAINCVKGKYTNDAACVWCPTGQHYSTIVHEKTNDDGKPSHAYELDSGRCIDICNGTSSIEGIYFNQLEVNGSDARNGSGYVGILEPAETVPSPSSTAQEKLQHLHL